jgi:quinol monooxygenase YgiN
MFALVVKMRIDPANAARFEKIFGDFGKQALEQEPGTLTYCLAKSRTEEGSYRAIEIYASEEAFKAHVAADAFQAFRPTFVGLLVEPPSSERLDVVA